MNWEVVSENITDQINQHFYMDDFLSFHSRTERLSSTAKIIIKLLSNSSFRLTKVAIQWQIILRHSEIFPKISKNQVQTEEVLGISSGTSKHTYYHSNLSTKYLKIHQLPIGMLTPFTLEPKLLVQELWQQKVEWDEIIPRDILQRWNKWKVSFNQIQLMNTPCWYGFHQQLCNIIKLHLFCDASSIA